MTNHLANSLFCGQQLCLASAKLIPAVVNDAPASARIPSMDMLDMLQLAAVPEGGLLHGGRGDKDDLIRQGLLAGCEAQPARGSVDAMPEL